VRRFVRAHLDAATEGYLLAFLIGVGLVGVAIVVALTVLQPSEAVAERPKAEPVHSEVG
jgi:hypothetical protein